MNPKFKIGDKVKHKRFGDGVVSSVLIDEGIYAVSVCFHLLIANFSIDGKYCLEHKQSLFYIK
jgi:hypothetical protein